MVTRTSLSDKKNDVIQALREENMTLKKRIKTLEAEFESSHIIWKKMDQYSRRDNVDVDIVSSSVKERELKDKSNEVSGKIDIKISEYDIKACHYLGKSSKTITCFVDRKICSKILKGKPVCGITKQILVTVNNYIDKHGVSFKLVIYLVSNINESQKEGVH